MSVQLFVLESERLEKLEQSKSKKLLTEALSHGYIGVTILVCIVLGQAGVGKTSMKYLLLDQRPPHLRNSTICAETPMRIHLRRVSQSRIQNLEGQWKEVKDEELLETVARMILLAESEGGEVLGEQATAAGLGAEKSPKGAKGKSSKKSEPSILTKIFNWVRRRDKEESSAGGGEGGNRSSEGAAVGDAAQASPTSQACQRAMKKIMDKLVQCISKLRLESEEGRPVTLSNPTEQLLKSKWIYFTDCGGQPQYHELLPLFVRRISSALCVTRLTDKLDEIQMAEYYEEGKPIGPAQQCQLSAKDTIQCLVNTVQSYSSQEQPPSIIMVGTHLDQLEEKTKQLSLAEAVPESSSGAAAQPRAQSLDSGGIETLEEKNKQLLEMLEPEFSSQLIPYCNDKKSLLFPVNSLNPGEEEKAIAHSIRCAMEQSGSREEKIPIWWSVLEILLQQLAKELERSVLSRSECLEMARLLNIREESFDAALVYFDELNVIKYNPAVLPHVIFVESQIPLDKVSELVYHSYLLRQPSSEASVSELSSSILRTLRSLKYFTEYGVVSEECLDQFPRHYVPGIFTKDDLIEYLKHLLVFAEIPPPVGCTKLNQKYYVMPALTVTLSEAELEKYRVSSSVAAALLVRFPGGSRRAGVYCCFIVHLIRYYSWKLLLDSKEPLYRNCATLQLLTSPPSTVTLIDSNTYIEVHVDITAAASDDEVRSTLGVVKGATLNGINAACVALKYRDTTPELTFFCPHPLPPTSSTDRSQKKHTASLTGDRKYWRCDLTPRLSGSLNEQQSIWFPGSFMTPSSIVLLSLISLSLSFSRCYHQSQTTSVNCQWSLFIPTQWLVAVPLLTS